MKQITIFDIIPDENKEQQCGYIDDLSLIGRELSFNELKEMIGKKVVICAPRQSATDYKVIKVTSYWTDCDRIYKRVRPLPAGCLNYSNQVNDYVHDVCGQKEAMACYELDYTCDRIGYVTKDNKNSPDHFVSEAWCRNGRFETQDEFPYSFYELV